MTIFIHSLALFVCLLGAVSSAFAIVDQIAELKLNAYHYYAEVLTDDGQLHGRSEGIIRFNRKATAHDLVDDLLDDFRTQRPPDRPLPDNAKLMIKSLTRL